MARYKGERRKRTYKFTKQQLAQALEKGGGFMSYAAQILECSVSVMEGALKRYPDLDERMTDIREAHLDLAEVQLLKRVREGNLTAITFFLKCKGRARGYVERQEHSIVSEAQIDKEIETELARLGSKKQAGTVKEIEEGSKSGKLLKISG